MSDIEINKEIEEKENYTNCNLELGDIIELYAPDNKDYHEQRFYIRYIDDKTVDLTNIETQQSSAIHLDDEGNIKDESITSITILSRSDEKGYAKQHNLLPKTWIDIHFNGEIVEAFTGEITNLEEDMIEITTYPDLDVIYIDFGYRGLPKHLDIDHITIRNKPASLDKISSLINIKDDVPDGETFDPSMISDKKEPTLEYQPSGEYDIQLPDGTETDKTLGEELQQMYNSGRELIHGEKLDDIEREYELPENQRRHGIDIQKNDMLDVLLSEIPDTLRTDDTVNNIHHLIQRFKELREKFSSFDEHNNIYDKKSNGIGHKPLSNSLVNLDKQLKWILPIVALKKKVYNDDQSEEIDGINDVVKLNISEEIISDANIQEQYYNNQLHQGDESSYVRYHRLLGESQKPFSKPNNNELLLAPNIEVQDSIETIVENLENLHSTVMSSTDNNVSYARRQYIIQKYNLSDTHMEPIISKTGKKIFIRSKINNNEETTVKSIMFLPKPVIDFSLVNLPGTSILKKSTLGEKYMYLFKLLTKKMNIDNNLIDNFDDEMDQKFWEIPLKDKSFYKNAQVYKLDEGIDQNPDRFAKYVKSIVPDTQNIIRLFDLLYTEKDHITMLNVHNAVKKLEPFLVYTGDINYGQLNAIRYFIKNKRIEYLKQLSDAQYQYQRVSTHNHMYDVPHKNRVENIFNEKKDILSVFLDLYDLTEYKSSKKDTYTTSHEYLKKIYATDGSELFHNLIRLLMISLITPENISAALKDTVDESEDMGKYEKIKASDCSRRVLSKKYTSMKNLQKDNGKETFYDKEVDDTPYDIMGNYKEESNKYSPEDMIEFLEEVLIQKHDCPPKLAPEMANNLIQGSKLVRDGEYALLEILPHLKKDASESELSDKEKNSIVDQADILKQMSYFKRVNNQWVHDDSVDDNTFIDTNTLFCNMSKICFKDQKKNVCENMNDTEKRLKITQRKKLLDEFDDRIEQSFEGLEEKLQQLVDKSRKNLKSKRRLQEVRSARYNDYAFELGKMINKLDVIKSPHLQHMEEILGQDDFVKKQKDILKFAELYCRDPMIEELGENMYYMYCTDTNKKLLPTSLYKLAQAYTSNNNYMSVLSEICRKQGRIEDDSIIDDYTGRLIRKIDFVDEDGFDEHGFRQITNDIIEKDLSDTIVASQEKKNTAKDRVFNNADTQLIFKLYRTIIGHIGITTDAIEEFVLRECVELINDTNVIKSERTYKIEAQELLETQKKRLPPYEIYRNKLIILIVTSIILVGIQTTIPSFKIQKTFPGCVQSFKGFPENNGAIEDTSGIEYLVCILNTLKAKSSKPWNSIKPLPFEVIKQQLMQLITQIILPKQTLTDLYVKKIEYLREHPNFDLPKEHSIQKWDHFLPPVVKYEVEKTIKGLPSDFKTQLNEMLKTGNKSQQKQLDMFKSKSALFSFAIMENINKTVRQKGLLLKTASGVYFTENACCNDKHSSTFMDYFMNESKELIVYIKMINDWGKVIETVKQQSIAPFLYHAKPSGITYSQDMHSEHFERNVYIAFIHYCNLDNDMSIPEDLQGLIAEKIHDYPKKSSVMEKIEFLKQNGKRLSNTNLLQLMDVVNKRNIVDAKQIPFKGSAVTALEDLLSHVDTTYKDDDDIVLCNKFRELLKGVLGKYNPKTLVAEDSDETYKLNNWLTHANSNLLERIVEFISKNSNLNRRKMDQLEEQLANIHLWNMDNTYEFGNDVSPKDETTMYSIVQFLKDSVFTMSKIYPEMIINNHIVNSKAHKHWGLAETHNLDISRFIQAYYKELSQFKNDGSLTSLLKQVQDNLIHVLPFLELIPTFLPIHRPPQGETPAQSYYSLFSKRTLYMIYSYVWYSVIYEYIKATDNEDLVQLNTIERNKIRRDKINEDRENGLGQSVGIYDEELSGYDEGMVEIQINVGDKNALNKTVGDLLLIFINMNTSNKKSFDLSYRDIDKKITRSKINEKKMITDFLKNMDDDQRRVEDTQKMMKLGRWNVGLKKGLVDYSKDRYKEEKDQLFEQLANKADIDMNDIVIQKDASEIEAEEAQDVDDYYDEEANDLRGYAGADGDGQYYEEDGEDEFNED